MQNNLLSIDGKTSHSRTLVYLYYGSQKPQLALDKAQLSHFLI